VSGKSKKPLYFFYYYIVEKGKGCFVKSRKENVYIFKNVLEVYCKEKIFPIKLDKYEGGLRDREPQSEKEKNIHKNLSSPFP